MIRITAVSLFLIFAALFTTRGYAQDAKLMPLTKYVLKDTTKGIKKDTDEQKDLNDVIQSLFRKNYEPSKIYPIGSKPIISFVPAIGYSLQTETAGTLTGNIVFRASPTSKVSAITTSMGFTQRRQFTLPIVSNIWTKNNNYVFLGDARFYVYPQSTYGLGSNSDIKDEQPMRYDLFRFSEVVLKHIAGDFFLGAGYKLQKHWNISSVEPLNGAPSDYDAYEKTTRTTSSGISLNSLFDSRDNSVNPSSGFYSSIEYYSYQKALGSNTNWQSIVIDLRKYYTFPASSDNVISFWSYDWLVLSGRPPYLDLPSTSWDTYSTTGRGYIQSRFRGAQMVYLETEYRFKILSNGLLGGVVFLNGQSFSAAPGTKLESMQAGYGPGLRIKLSKVSKTNLDIDYGFGREGSRGLFLTVGEVF
ncbi:MAG: hypothetical protein ABI203_09010 [Mucilaginibacter sp.]